MGAWILAGLVQVALNAQDVLAPHRGPVFGIEELGVLLQYWSVLRSIGQYWSVVSELRGVGAGAEFLPGIGRSSWLRRGH